MKIKMYTALMCYIFLSSIIVAQEVGPKTETVNDNSYSKVFYVSVNGSDVNGNGSVLSPWQSIQTALEKCISPSSQNTIAIKVAEGKYYVNDLKMKEYVRLFGGYNDKSWDRNIFLSKTILDGKDQGRLFIATDNCRIDGFIIQNGKVRDRGGAIIFNNCAPTISNNLFVGNQTLGPDPWNPKNIHEQANDGGAIYAEDGSSSIIKNNIFYKNVTENGRGGGIAFHKNCSGEIVNNVFMENITGSQDPKRSSDGGAVSIFNWSNPLVENNIFLNNKSLASNDAGGLFVALWSSPKIYKNIFVGNASSDDAGALFVGGQEHRYDVPLDPLPPKEKFYVEIDRNLFVGNQNPSGNSGVTRFTMESRGSFTNNICAYNTGIYFQRSETEISNNTIMENFILIETKDGLGKTFVKNNIIWGKLNIDAPSEFESNDSREILAGKNIYEDPHFINDGKKYFPFTISYDPSTLSTKYFFSGENFKKDELTGRVVRVGKDWGVVKSNSKNTIEVWGNLSNDIEITLLPSFKLNSNSPCIGAGINIPKVKTDYYGNKRPLKGRASNKFNIGAVE